MPSLRPIIRHLLHLVLPVDCAGCGVALAEDPIPFFCRACWSQITPLKGPSCPRCGRPFPSSVALAYSPDHLCSDCRKRRPAFTKAWSLYPYSPPLQDAIRLFKYHGKTVLAEALGDLMLAASPAVEVDLLMPVPLHPSRLREREFNQSLLLADRLTRRWRTTLSFDNLIRARLTESQTALSRSARQKNLRRSFIVRRPDEVEGRRVLLIDDVFTTGTTVNECAKTLRKAGANDVYVCTLARTL